VENHHPVLACLFHSLMSLPLLSNADSPDTLKIRLLFIILAIAHCILLLYALHNRHNNSEVSIEQPDKRLPTVSAMNSAPVLSIPSNKHE
jgi:hypothetical protein